MPVRSLTARGRIMRRRETRKAVVAIRQRLVEVAVTRHRDEIASLASAVREADAVLHDMQRALAFLDPIDAHGAFEVSR